MAGEPVSRILRSGSNASCEQSTYGKQRTYAVSDVNCVSRARIAGTRWAHLHCGLSLLVAAVIFAASASAQDHRVFRIPFHTANGLILLEGHLNGRPAALLLDTGSNVSFVDVGSARSIHFKADKVRRVGMTGCIKAYEHLALAGQKFDGQGLCVADLADIQKSTATHVDGFLGQDFLRAFSILRIDYKAQVVEFEQ